MESVLVAGFAAAFVLSVLDYWVQSPLVKALAGVASALGCVLLLDGWTLAVIPEALAAAFVGALAMSFAGRVSVAELRTTRQRL